jgi:Uma2 family endonuclease
MLMEAHLKQRLLTVQEYHRMSETGILTESDRVELLNGQIIYMSPIGSKHAACVEKIGELLV